jgi:hypothetical protein
MKAIILLIVLASACTTAKLYEKSPFHPEDDYGLYVFDEVEIRPYSNYYEYKIVAKTPDGYFHFSYIPQEPMPMGRPLKLVDRDAVVLYPPDTTSIDSLKAAGYQGDIRKVDFLFKQKKRRK